MVGEEGGLSETRAVKVIQDQKGDRAEGGRFDCVESRLVSDKWVVESSHVEPGAAAPSIMGRDHCLKIDQTLG